MEKLNDKFNMNYVEARGKIIGSYVDRENKKMITLFVRGSRQDKGTYLKFALKDGIKADFKVEDNVLVKGYIRSYQRNSELWTTKKTPFDQILIAEEIVVEKPEIDEFFGIKGGFAPKDSYAKLFASGTVIENKRIDNSIWKVIVLKVDNNGYKPYEIRMQHSIKMKVNKVNIEVGDKVAVMGVIVSARKTYRVNSRANDSTGESGERTVTRDFENIIIDDLVFIEKAKAEEAAK